MGRHEGVQYEAGHMRPEAKERDLGGGYRFGREDIPKDDIPREG